MWNWSNRGWLLAISLVGFINSENAFAADPGLQQAVQTLVSTKPMRAPLLQMGLIDPVQRQAAEKLYDQQINAIAALGLSKDPAVAIVLIPYLNYPKKGFSFHFTLGQKAEDLIETRSNWPAFSALLEIPSSSTVLMNYALDPKNPIDFRVAAFLVLRYQDQSKFKTISQTFNQEFASAGPHTKEYIAALEDGSLPFSGAYPIKFKE